MADKAKSTQSKRQALPGLSEPEVEAFIADNQQALNSSIKRARAEVKKGLHSTRSVKDIATAGAKKLRSKAKRAAR